MKNEEQIPKLQQEPINSGVIGQIYPSHSQLKEQYFKRSKRYLARQKPEVNIDENIVKIKDKVNEQAKTVLDFIKKTEVSIKQVIDQVEESNII